MPIGGETQERDITVPFFFQEAVENPSSTKANGGIAVHDNVDMVRIIVPGMRDEVVRPVEPRDMTRWPLYWDRYKKGLEHKVDGTPLSEFSTASPAEIATLRGSGLQTIEQLAGLNDDACQKLHVVQLRTKAQTFLRTNADLANVGKLHNKIKELEKKVEELTNANAARVVPGSDGGNGVQPALVNSGEQQSGRQEVGQDRKPRRKRTGDAEQVA